MKKLIPVAFLAMLCACNNSKKEKSVVTGDTTNSNVNTGSKTTTSNTPAGSANVSYSVADTARSLSGSVLVQADKDKLSPGNDNMAMITGSNSNGESISVNFVFALKPGVYPVVGLGLTKGEEVYGGILGGKPKLTDYKVNLSECTDLGSNNLGGHKWKISGSVDQDITIDAMSIMKMSPGHPDAVKVSKFRFSNLTFDDNWEQILEEGMKKLKKQE